MISLRNVSKRYNKRDYALKNISFDVKAGEFIFLVGDSGSGKSTIFKMMYKEEVPTEGNIEIFNRPLVKTKKTKLRRKIGVVFQDYKLLNNKTVFENVSYPLLSLGTNPFTVKKETIRVLEMMGIEKIQKKKPQELSGGEQQRVAIARAVISKPKILLCDEPTGNLDRTNTLLIMEHLQKLNDNGTTIIMTTHDEQIVKEMNKRTITLKQGILISDSKNAEENKFKMKKTDDVEKSKMEILKNSYLNKEKQYVGRGK